MTKQLQQMLMNTGSRSSAVYERIVARRDTRSTYDRLSGDMMTLGRDYVRAANKVLTETFHDKEQRK